MYRNSSADLLMGHKSFDGSYFPQSIPYPHEFLRIIIRYITLPELYIMYSSVGIHDEKSAFFVMGVHAHGIPLLVRREIGYTSPKTTMTAMGFKIKILRWSALRRLLARLLNSSKASIANRLGRLRLRASVTRQECGKTRSHDHNASGIQFNFNELVDSFSFDPRPLDLQSTAALCEGHTHHRHHTLRST